MSDFTAEDKMRCAERELKFRVRVYEGMVGSRKMTQRQADREIGLMEAIMQDYKVLAEKDRLL